MEKSTNLKIEYIDINELVPYEKNPRDNSRAVKYVANSIKKFGFKNPIIIDKNNVITCGHTRVKAAKELGIEKVPCIRASDLTPKEIKAFRIADNRVQEFAEWDFDLLNEELEDIALDEADLADINMADFDLETVIHDEYTSTLEDIPELGDTIENSNEKETDEEFIERLNKKYGEDNVVINYDDEGNIESATVPSSALKTIEQFNLHLLPHHTDEYGEFIVDTANTVGFFNFPVIHKTDFVPEKILGFNMLSSNIDNKFGIHFYIEDGKFNSTWETPEDYVDRFKMLPCVIAPDYSVYHSMPNAMKIWNYYRNRVVANYWQRMGVTVIPTISCNIDEDMYKFAFEGIEPGGTISMSTIRVGKNPDILERYKKALPYVLEKLNPSTLIIYGGKIDFGIDFGDRNVVYFENTTNLAYKPKERW